MRELRGNDGTGKAEDVSATTIPTGEVPVQEQGIGNTNRWTDYIHFYEGKSSASTDMHENILYNKNIHTQINMCLFIYHPLHVNSNNCLSWHFVISHRWVDGHQAHTVFCILHFLHQPRSEPQPPTVGASLPPYAQEDASSLTSVILFHRGYSLPSVLYLTR